MTEATYGRLWAALARHEGHRKRLPPSYAGRKVPLYCERTKPRRERVLYQMHDQTSLLAQAIRYVREEGMTHKAAAKKIGVSRGRVSQTLKDAA